jgi:hypothetical protein
VAQAWRKLWRKLSQLFLIQTVTLHVRGSSGQQNALGDGLKSPEVDGETAADSHRKVQAMIRAGSDHKAVETFVRQNARQYPFEPDRALRRHHDRQG